MALCVCVLYGDLTETWLVNAMSVSDGVVCVVRRSYRDFRITENDHGVSSPSLF